MSDAAPDDPAIEVPSPPVDIEVTIDGAPHRLRYDQAFVFGCSLVEQGNAAEAAKLFERLEEFVDRGPRAFIMQAFCESAALHFDKSSKPLQAAFEGENPGIANALHSAFVSYHVGIRRDALNSMIALVNKHQDLPTLCLLLGNMLESADNLPMARKCWSLAVHRDRTGGAVAAVAIRQLRKTADKSSASDLDEASGAVA